MTDANSPGHDIAEESQDSATLQRSGITRIILVVCGLLIFSGFFALGTWQIKRLYWKLDLIDRVSQRVHADPVPVPEKVRWAHVNAESDEYRHVQLRGTFLYPLTVWVQALTELGSGFWLLTPLRLSDGNVVLINRGYVPAIDKKNLVETTLPNDSVVDITGLLRITEPGGAFLRHNDPTTNRWYSRDVQAIATALKLNDVAPYFIDADADANKNGASSADASEHPVGGLTVVTFHNNHLVYAITWYVLALMVVGACWRVLRYDRD